MQRDAFRPVRFYQKGEQGSEQGKGDEVHIAVSMLLTFHLRYYSDAVCTGAYFIAFFLAFCLFSGFRDIFLHRYLYSSHFSACLVIC